MSQDLFLLLRYIISGAGPKKKKAVGLCLRSQLESFSKLLYFSRARKFCEEKQYCWHSEFAGAGEGGAGSFNSRGSGQDLSCWLPLPGQLLLHNQGYLLHRLQETNKPTQQNNKPTSILTKSQVLRQIPLTWMLQHITSSSGP